MANNCAAIIKNVSGFPYDVEEMPGVTIQDNAEIDLFDDSLPSFYEDWQSVKELLTTLSTARLCQDIIAGKIEIVEMRSPF